MISVRQRFKEFFRCLEAFGIQIPTDIHSAVPTLPRAESMPSPGSVWFFVALILYRARQRWAREQLLDRMPDIFYSLEEHLAQEQEALAHAEELLAQAQESQTRIPMYPDVDYPDEIDVPGMLNWYIEQFFTCNYVNLIGRRSREVISVSLSKHMTENIVFPTSLHQRMPCRDRLEPIGRFSELCSTDDSRWDAMAELVEAGLLDEVDYAGFHWEEQDGPDGHMLTKRGLAHADEILEFTRQWSEPHCRPWLAALVGDWALVHELAQTTNNAELACVASERLRLSAASYGVRRQH